MSPCLGQTVSRGYVIPAVIFFIAAFLVPEAALADSMTMYLEEDYTTGSLKTTDQSGKQTTTNIDNFDQLYNLYMDKTIFPNLDYDFGGLFGRNQSVITDDTETHSAENLYNIFTDLKLNAKPFSSAIGYYKKSDTSVADSSAAPGTSLTNVDERYNALFSWKPGPDLPALDFNYTKDFTFDGRRILFDNETDQILLGIKYDPVSTLDLTYNYNYIDTFNKLDGSDTANTTHTGRIVFDDNFFNKRAHLSAIYDISSQGVVRTGGNTETLAQIQLFPTAGLSAISDTTNPSQTPTMVTLNNNAALIDNSLTASAGINLGLNSGLVTVPPPPRQEWNIGLDFTTQAKVGAFSVWVTKDLTKIADLFSWDIYTSSDNLNWTKQFTVTVPPSAPPASNASGFSTLPLPHFVINFPTVTTPRYIKVVVKPLDSLDQTTLIVRGLNPTDFNDVFVTELQAFQVTTISSAGATTSQSQVTQHFDLNGRAKLFENRNLFYDLTLFLARTDPIAQTTAFLSNGLSFSQKLGSIFTVNARAAREDNYLINGHGVDYQYSASLSALPFATLNDSFIYSGHHTTNPNGTTNIQNSFFLYNTAILYPGINALANGGVTIGTLETGQNSQTLQGNAGLTLVPNQNMNINLSYNITNSTLSGGGKPDSSVTNYIALASATYTPVSALYLFASVQFNEVNNILQTLKNYGVNFSPFPDGALQFHFVYSETLGPLSNEKNRLITPSLRWNIRPGAYLDVSYSIQQSNIESQSTDARILSSSLKISL